MLQGTHFVIVLILIIPYNTQEELDILIVTSIRAYNTQEELEILIVTSIRALC